MKQGTMSVLLGCHSPVHSLLVLIAWCKLYRRFPKPWQLICILIHDIGHWGTMYLDNPEEKERHSVLGAKIAGKLFGQRGHDLILGHNSYNGMPRSELYDPDKYSWTIAPIWWMVSNTWFEPKLQRRGSTRRESALMFKRATIENGKTGFQERGYDIYLKQWGHNS